MAWIKQCKPSYVNFIMCTCVCVCACVFWSFKLSYPIFCLSFFLSLFFSLSLSLSLFISLPLFLSFSLYVFLSLINECMPEFLRLKWPNSYVILPSISRYLFSALSLLLSLSLSFLFLRFSSVKKRKYFVRLTTVCKRDKKTVRCNFLPSHITRERERESEQAKQGLIHSPSVADGWVGAE